MGKVLSYQDSIQKLRGLSWAVEVRGVTFLLQVPNPGVAEEARAIWQMLPDITEGRERYLKSWEMSVKALSACLPEATAEEVHAILNADGGTDGPISFAALHLCGMPDMSRARESKEKEAATEVAERDAVDPTS